ncbi:MAG: hypothetical protein ABSC06_34155 [Rhodopila sp.]|jgi:hypothetical protein
MNTRTTAILLALSLAGCAGKTIPLPEVGPDDPVVQLNPDRWEATVNDLIVLPGDGSPRPLAAPVPDSSERFAQ